MGELSGRWCDWFALTFGPLIFQSKSLWQQIELNYTSHENDCNCQFESLANRQQHSHMLTRVFMKLPEHRSKNSFRHTRPKGFSSSCAELTKDSHARSHFHTFAGRFVPVRRSHTHTYSSTHQTRWYAINVRNMCGKVTISMRRRNSNKLKCITTFVLARCSQRSPTTDYYLETTHFNFPLHNSPINMPVDPTIASN